MATMVTPLPPVKAVKTAQATIATKARLPGIHPKSERVSRTSRSGVPLSAKMYPAKVKSGTEMRMGEVASGSSRE